MRKVIELTQDEIDELVQKQGAYKRAEYNNLRALQDGLVSEVKTAFEIIRKKV